MARFQGSTRMRRQMREDTTRAPVEDRHRGNGELLGAAF